MSLQSDPSSNSTGHPEVQVGDTVDVRLKITEGEKTRVQVFKGTVIRKKGGSPCETFTVRRLVDGQGVERTFCIDSPLLVGLDVQRHGVTHRAKLHYLRDRVGKATRLKERRPKVAEAATPKKRRKRGARAKAERKARAAAEARAAEKHRRPGDSGAGVAARLRPTDPPFVPPKPKEGSA